MKSFILAALFSLALAAPKEPAAYTPAPYAYPTKAKEARTVGVLDEVVPRGVTVFDVKPRATPYGAEIKRAPVYRHAPKEFMNAPVKRYSAEEESPIEKLLDIDGAVEGV